jgi:hypothetical protein
MSIAAGAMPSAAPASGPADGAYPDSEPVIVTLKPKQADGRGYRLVYTVDASLEATWDFKTDFASQVLLSNKLISAHRLVSQDGNVAVTETVYYNKPGLVFRWKTTVFPEQHLLEYVLLNPQECGQEYHFGTIKLEAVAAATRVTQEAWFDFFGVSLWVNNPFRGGMSHFLKTTARWEQQAVPAYRQPNPE